MQEDWGLVAMARKSRAESIEKMNHADKLIARGLFLERHPNLQKLDPLRIGEGPRETLECDLAGEDGRSRIALPCTTSCRLRRAPCIGPAPWGAGDGAFPLTPGNAGWIRRRIRPFMARKNRPGNHF